MQYLVQMFTNFQSLGHIFTPSFLLLKNTSEEMLIELRQV